MFTFITAVRHPRTALSYANVEALLKRSLRSVCNQTDPEFTVIVVCNQMPVDRIVDERVRYVVTPELPLETDNLLHRTRVDKGFKLALGLASARDVRPQHVMLFDADDFVHCRIVEHSHRHPDAPGWYIDHGFVYDEKTKLLSPLSGFHEVCGTSHIISYELVEPIGIVPTSTRQHVLSTLGDEYVSLILGAHPFILEFFGTRGHALAPLPFYGAIYVRGTGENDRRWFTAPGFPRPTSARVRSEFGMDKSQLDEFKAYLRWPRAIASHVVRSIMGSPEPFNHAVRDEERKRVLRIP